MARKGTHTPRAPIGDVRDPDGLHQYLQRFNAWQAERNYSGNNEQARLDVLNFARRRGLLDLFHAFADQCLRDYDLDGWTSPTWTFDGHEPT